jgi:hypothetical protein
LALKRLTAEFGMGSGLAASLRATRPAKDKQKPSWTSSRVDEVWEGSKQEMDFLIFAIVVVMDVD